MKKLQGHIRAWGVINERGELVVCDGHTPVFWLRSVARRAATEWGFETYGPNADARIVRVVIKPDSPK